MSLVWIDCIRRLKKEAQDAANEEEEKSAKKRKESLGIGDPLPINTFRNKNVTFLVHQNP